MRRVAIINKPAWQRCGLRRTRRWLGILQRDLGAEVFFTDYPGHAAALVRASAGADLIIASGGDGTVHEVVNAMDLDRQTLAIAPIGTGNGLCRDLSIYSVEQSLRTAGEGRARRIDVIKYRLSGAAGTTVRYGVSTAGIGFVCDVASFANRRMKGWGGLCYPLATFATLWSQRRIEATVELDGKDRGVVEFTNLVINNGQYVGNFCVFPHARPDDSFFHVLTAKMRPATQLLYAASVLTRTYGVEAGVLAKASSLRVRLKGEALSFMADGEIYASVNEVECALLPRCLAVAG